MLNNTAHLFYIILSPMLSVVFAILNAITINIYCRNFKLTAMCTILIVNICICDICVCLLSNSVYVVTLVHPKYSWSFGSLSCKLFKFLTMLLNVAQIYFLCFLTADRLRRLIHATRTQWGKRHGLMFAVIGWALAVVVTSPRLVLFDEMKIPNSNLSEIVNIKCKPSGMDTRGYMIYTILFFIVAFAIPAMFIINASIRTHLFMWKRRTSIHVSSMNNFVTKMRSRLSLTFNLTAIFFMIIWTPFFCLSLLDLTMNLLGRKDLQSVNFALRCTLLIAGSGKPIIYMICLENFRSHFTFSTSRTFTEPSTHQGSSSRNAVDTKETIVALKNTENEAKHVTFKTENGVIHMALESTESGAQHVALKTSENKAKHVAAESTEMEANHVALESTEHETKRPGQDSSV